MRALGVFLAVALADWLWTRYIVTASAGLAWQAGGYSSAIVIVGGFVTLSYVRDRRYLLPAALGAFLGTYLSVHAG